MENVLFPEQMNFIKIKNLRLLGLIHEDPQTLVAENIEFIANLYQDILTTLTSIGNLDDSRAVKNERKSKILLSDVLNLTDKVVNMTTPIDTLKISQRESLLQEIETLLRRIDNLKMDEITIPPQHIDRLHLHKSCLYEKQEEAEGEKRKLEHIERARAQESIKSATSSTLQKLQGFQNWLSWYKQQKIVLENIQHSQTKLTIIYQSLSNPKDKKFLKGVTSFEHQMNY